MGVQAKRSIVANGKGLEVEAGATFRTVATALGDGKVALAARAAGRN